MSIFLLILTVIFFILLLIVTAMRPKHSDLSEFELEHRADIGDREAKRLLDREKLLIDIVSLQRVVTALLLIIITLLAIAALGLLAGVGLAIIVALEYGAIARLGFIKVWSQKLYERIERPVFGFINKFPLLLRLIGSTPGANSVSQLIGSRAELQHVIDHSNGILTANEKTMIVHSLSFGDRLVSSIMTPRDAIISINKSEFLGPLTLNDLHKVGHSRLPVINDELDYVVGVLYLNSLLTLDIKRSTTAEKAMDPKVYYIRDDQTLQHALAAFLRTHNHLLIVVNRSRQTVGLLTMNDVMEALLGRKIVDEFDGHDNLRVVAMRKSD